jgi:hypothetical protein
MLVLTLQPGDRIVCHKQKTGEVVQIEVRKAAGGNRFRLAIDGPKTITYRRLAGIKQQAGKTAD